MQFIVYLLICVAVIVNAIPLTEDQTQSLFTRYITQYKKEYETSKFFTKYNTFKDNLNYILAFNEKNTGVKLAINKYGDMTNKEYQAFHKLRPVSSSLFKMAGQKIIGDAPKSIDWVKKGVVNAVKDQGNCGSCYAFSAIAALESAVAIKLNGTEDESLRASRRRRRLHHMSSSTPFSVNLPLLSEQQVVDCSHNEGNEGCGGGLMTSVFEYLMKDGSCNEKDYAYTGTDGQCKSCKAAIKVKDYTVVSSEHGQLEQAIGLKGPVSIAVDASSPVFMFYSSGVIIDGCGEWLNHGVAAVGYGETEEGVQYFLVRNSWGSGWGDNGYVKIGRNIKDKNVCGIENEYNVIPNVL